MTPQGADGLAGLDVPQDEGVVIGGGEGGLSIWRKCHTIDKLHMTGEGADEALGGYNIFKEVLIRHFWARIPRSKIRPLLLKKLYPYIPQLQNANVSLLRLFFGY